MADNYTFSGYFVESVLGPVNDSQLGTTLTHEHLLSDYTQLYTVSPSIDYNFTSSSLLQNFGYVKQYPYSNLYNLRLNDRDGSDATRNEVKLFKDCVGGTIVEKSSNLNRNFSDLQTLSEMTNVNIIIGTGYHITDTRNLLTCTTTGEEMYNNMRNEMEVGCRNYSDVKAGFIADGGNILLDFEKRALRAIGEIQEHFHYPVSFHPGRQSAPLLEIMRIYQEAGGKATQFVMSHIDRTLITREDFYEFINETNCFVQFDQFGVECSFDQLNLRTEILSDAQSIKCIARMKQERKLDRVLMSHDIHTKHRLTAFGGLGYIHITKNIVPIMLNRDFTEQDIFEIRVINPSKWLTRHKTYS